MSAQAGHESWLPSAPWPARALDPIAFADMFDAHAAHLFDYCLGLLGSRTEAAHATQVTLIAAHSLVDRMPDPGRLRAWLLALARWECLTSEPGRSLPRADAAAAAGGPELADETAGADAEEVTRADIDAVGGGSVRARLRALDDSEREVLNLIYRHGVSPAELPAVLGTSVASANVLASTAEMKFRQSAGTQAGQASGREQAGPEWLSAALPLAALPSSLWRHTARAVMDPRFREYRDAVGAHASRLHPDGFPVQPDTSGTPSRRRLTLASLALAGLLLAPAAGGAAAYVAFSTPAAAHAASHGHASTTRQSPDPSSAIAGAGGGGPSHSPARGHGKKSATPPVYLGPGVLPVVLTSPTPKPHTPKPSPTPETSTSSSPPAASPPPSPSPSPSASPSPSPSSSPSSSTIPASAPE